MAPVFGFLLLAISVFHINNADEQFRGGYITYTIDNEGDLEYTITARYASAWKIGPTACVGDTSQTNPSATSIDLQSLIAGQGTRSAPSSLVQCSTISNDGTVRVGSNTWQIPSLVKTDFYFLKYNIDTRWNAFPCCAAQMSGASTSNSITMQTSLQTGEINNRNALNNPPQFSSLLLIEIQAGQSQSYTIPVTDPESNVIRCRLPSSSEAGALARIDPTQATITSGCTFTIDATTKVAGEYPMAFMVEDFSSSTSTTPLHSVPYQIVYSVTSQTVTPTQNPNTIDATVTCTRNNMRVEIPVSEFASGTAPASNSVTFSSSTNTNCASQIINNAYVLSTALNQCGTSFESQDATHINYINTVIIGSAIVGSITRSFTGVQIKVRCKYRSDYTSENDKSYIANVLASIEEENFGQFSIILRAFDASYSTPITQFPMNVDLSSRQYCQIDVTDNNDDTVVISERVFASTSPSRATGQTHNLIINRCPNEFDTTVRFENTVSTRSQFRFSFEAFVFSSNAAEQVFVHCDTFLCHEDSQNARCNQQCDGYSGANANNVGRISPSVGKKRREIVLKGNRTIDIDEPSNIYYLVAGPFVLLKEDEYERLIPSELKDNESFWKNEIYIVASAIVIILVVVVAVCYVSYQKAKMRMAMAEKGNAVKTVTGITID